MRFGSLFSGIGGLDLGLERAGMECRWQCEIDPYCQRVLSKHWPKVKQYSDVRGLKLNNDLEPVDLICGGFPCQPVSVAGARKGQEDERWLWPDFGRIVCRLRPRYVLVENTSGLASLGFGDVLGDLASLGYDAEWESLPAAAFGAPHLRWRVFIVAYADSYPLRSESLSLAERRRAAEPRDDGSQWRVTEQDAADADGLGRQIDSELHRRWSGVESGQAPHGDDADGCSGTDVSDSHVEGLQNSLQRGSWRAGETRYDAIERSGSSDGGRGDVQDSSGSGREGRWATRPGREAFPGTFSESSRSDWWLSEPDVGRVAHGVSKRVDRIRVLGNGVVPQVAEWIGRQIMERERAIHSG